jgi:hypothetical protein
VNSFAPYPQEITRLVLLSPYLDEARRFCGSPDKIRQPVTIRGINVLLALLYLPILLAVILSSILFVFSSRSRALWGAFAATSLFVFSYNFGHTLLTAILHTADNQRYSHMQFPMSLFAIFIGGLFLAEVALRRFRGVTPGRDAERLLPACN